MAIRFQNGKASPISGASRSDKAIERKALTNSIAKMEQMKRLAQELRMEFNASTSTGGPLWRQPGFEEIPATINGYIPDLLDREIRRARQLLGA